MKADRTGSKADATESPSKIIVFFIHFISNRISAYGCHRFWTHVEDRIFVWRNIDQWTIRDDRCSLRNRCKWVGYCRFYLLFYFNNNAGNKIHITIIWFIRRRAIVVRLGSISLLTSDHHTRIVPIAKIHNHPDYNKFSKHNDIALMRLTHTIYFNEFVRPACLNVHSDLEWSTAIATGFGVTSQGKWMALHYYCCWMSTVERYYGKLWLTINLL